MGSKKKTGGQWSLLRSLAGSAIKFVGAGIARPTIPQSPSAANACGHSEAQACHSLPCPRFAALYTREPLGGQGRPPLHSKSMLQRGGMGKNSCKLYKWCFTFER